MNNTSKLYISTNLRFGINGMFLLYFSLFSVIALWNQIVILCTTVARKRKLLHHNIMNILACCGCAVTFSWTISFIWWIWRNVGWKCIVYKRHHSTKLLLLFWQGNTKYKTTITTVIRANITAKNCDSFYPIRTWHSECSEAPYLTVKSGKSLKAGTL
jgi:hypothetical protein